MFIEYSAHKQLLCFLLCTEAFPLDEVNGDFVRTVKNCVFSRSFPTPLKGPLRLAAVSKVTSNRKHHVFIFNSGTHATRFHRMSLKAS